MYLLVADTVDGRNICTKLDMYKNPVNNGVNYQPQLVVWDF